jgi:hypothetical protein
MVEIPPGDVKQARSLLERLFIHHPLPSPRRVDLDIYIHILQRRRSSPLQFPAPMHASPALQEPGGCPGSFISLIPRNPGPPRTVGPWSCTHRHQVRMGPWSCTHRHQVRMGLESGWEDSPYRTLRTIPTVQVRTTPQTFFPQ